MVLSLRIALLRLSPAASRGPAAPSHGGRGRRSGLAEVAVVHGRATGLSRRGGRARGVALRRGGALKAGTPPNGRPVWGGASGEGRPRGVALRGSRGLGRSLEQEKRRRQPAGLRPKFPRPEDF